MPHHRSPAAGVHLALLIAAGAAVCVVSEAGDLSGVAGRAVAAARGPAPSRTTVDPAVVPAGGAACCSATGECGRPLQAGFHHGHAAGCRDGMCVPACPVRPGQFGYYGTQWRRWPGQGVSRASATEPATPVQPPKSAIPGPDEESPATRDEAGAAVNPPEPPRGAHLAPAVGPWSRMVASASLPVGYAPPGGPRDAADDSAPQ